MSEATGQDLTIDVRAMSEQELRAAARDPNLTVQAIRAARAELERRGLSQPAPQPHRDLRAFSDEHLARLADDRSAPLDAALAARDELARRRQPGGAALSGKPCDRCGTPVPDGAGYAYAGDRVCGECFARAMGMPVAAIPGARPGAPARTPAATPVTTETHEGRAWMLGLAGALFFALGLYFLFNPGVPVDADFSAIGLGRARETVNLQRLAFGQTFAVVGAIFLAAALRPLR